MLAYDFPLSSSILSKSSNSMEKIQSLFQKVVISIIAFIVCFAILEWAARIYITRLADDRTFFYNASLRQLEERASHTGNGAFKKSYHRYLGFYLTPNYVNGKNRHNALGYRGDEITMPKPEGEYRIVCIGGSTTYTSAVEDYHQSYPDVLEAQLKQRGYQNVNVINAGVPGWSSWESLINFQFRILDIEPDMIVVYHGLNDIHARMVWPPEAYVGDNSGRSIPAATSVFMPSILEYSTLIRIFMVRLGLTRPHVDINRTIDRQADTYFANEFHYQVKRNLYPSGIFKKVTAAQMLATNKPRFFKRNMENLVSLAQMHGVKTVLATFAFSRLFPREARASSEEYLRAYSEHNDILKDIAEHSNAELFDFADVFPEDKKYYDDGRHVTVEGAALKGKMFADFLVNRLLIPH